MRDLAICDGESLRSHLIQLAFESLEASTTSGVPLKRSRFLITDTPTPFTTPARSTAQAQHTWLAQFAPLTWSIEQMRSCHRRNSLKCAIGGIDTIHCANKAKSARIYIPGARKTKKQRYYPLLWTTMRCYLISRTSHLPVNKIALDCLATCSCR